MECILIGTGGMMPMPYRLLASMALRLNGWIYLFDAGEGTQLGWKKSRLGVRGIRLIAVTHLHADHCLGIPGLMMLKAQMENPGPLTIIGPPGIREFIEQNLRIMEFRVNYPVSFLEWSGDDGGPAYEDEQVRVFWHSLQHTRLCLGYRIEELDRPGRFDPAKAERLRIPKGPLWGMLQRGESITVEDGRVIEPGRVVGPARRGRHVAYVVDTRPAKGIYKLCRNVDVAFIEGMFLPEDAEHADVKGHMTVAEGASVARRSGAARAVLTHLSPRYAEEDMDRLEAAARNVFEGATIGKDLEVYPVRLPD